MSTEVRKEYYSTGELHWETPFVNGKQHGIASGYHTTGVVWWTVSWDTGCMHGISKKYSKSGDLIETWYCLYGEIVTKEEYRVHQLTEELAGI